MSDAFELGLALFKREPELLGAEVWRRAALEGPESDQHEFVAGYMRGRFQRDEYEREQRDGEH